MTSWRARLEDRIGRVHDRGRLLAGRTRAALEQQLRRARVAVWHARRSPAYEQVRAAWRSRPSRALRRAAPWALGAVTLVVGLITVAGVGLASQHGERLSLLPLAPDNCPTRLYAQPMRLSVGSPIDLDRLERTVETLRYRVADDRLETGTYLRTENRFTVVLRRYPLPVDHTSFRGESRVDVVVAGGKIDKLLLDGAPSDGTLALEPVELAALYDDSLVDCRPVLHDEIPGYVTQAILAAEDDGFFDHGGVDAVGILRAAWVNATAGEVRQGGSTLTQQLVKNLYLTPERSLSRKAREAVLALALEARHSKGDIITSYLNHAYWGRRGSVQLVGIDAAARGWFDKNPGELELHEAALLAGMIRSPGALDPIAHPDRSRARRDWVIDRLSALGWIDSDTAAEARARELGVRPRALDARRAPYFVDWVSQEARQRFGIDVEGGGYRILTTLDWDDQVGAEDAVREQLAELRRHEQLQAALISLDPRSGSVRAWVGGRDYAESEFDRVSQARRQVGSTFKPFVYAAAIETGAAMPGDTVYDAPLLVSYGDEYWLPRNNDRDFRGPIAVQRALELSLNVPTVRVALAAGVHRVRDMGARLSLVGAADEAVPSLALGTAETSPLSLARAYSAFATGGTMPYPHGIESVYEIGRRVPGTGVPKPVRVISPNTASLMTEMLQNVVRRGTGGALRRLGLRDAVAGKTGTSDDQRDSWFAGYTPERTTVVWVGRDDDRSTGYYGSQAALPIWGHFMQAVRPDGGYREWEDNDDLVSVTIDPLTGELATASCAESLIARYPDGSEPTAFCRIHGGSDDAPVAAEGGARDVAAAILRPKRYDWTPWQLLWSDTRSLGRQGGTYFTTHPTNLQLDAPDPYATTTAETEWDRFQERLRDWEINAVTSGTVRVFEVPASLALPCVDGDRSAIESSACREQLSRRVGT